MANELENLSSEIGEQPVYVISFSSGSITDAVKAAAEEKLGKVAWLEYTRSERSPSVEMFQPKPSAEALFAGVQKLVEGQKVSR
jgi:hypothetical protein